MTTFIALLRGINVSGHKKVPMAELRALLSKTGFHDVQTYIQSGNIVFKSEETDNSKLEDIINQSILNHFGFDVPVFVKTNAELKSVFEGCPFSKEKKEKSYFTLLHSKPERSDIDEVQKASYANEEFITTSECVYMFYALGAGKAKLSNNWFEKKLNVKATSRNYRTIVKLLEMSA